MGSAIPSGHGPPAASQDSRTHGGGCKTSPSICTARLKQGQCCQNRILLQGSPPQAAINAQSQRLLCTPEAPRLKQEPRGGSQTQWGPPSGSQEGHTHPIWSPPPILFPQVLTVLVARYHGLGLGIGGLCIGALWVGPRWGVRPRGVRPSRGVRPRWWVWPRPLRKARLGVGRGSKLGLGVRGHGVGGLRVGWRGRWWLLPPKAVARHQETLLMGHGVLQAVAAFVLSGRGTGG